MQNDVRPSFVSRTRGVGMPKTYTTWLARHLTESYGPLPAYGRPLPEGEVTNLSVNSRRVPCPYRASRMGMQNDASPSFVSRTWGVGMPKTYTTWLARHCTEGYGPLPACGRPLPEGEVTNLSVSSRCNRRNQMYQLVPRLPPRDAPITRLLPRSKWIPACAGMT